MGLSSPFPPCRAALLCLAVLAMPAAAQSPWGTIRFPQDQARWGWDDAWWDRGTIPAPSNHAVASRAAAYRSGDVEIPVEIHAPRGTGDFPVVVFFHGRRGIGPVTRLVPLRLAARGFTVVVPDLYSGRFIAAYPIRHDPALEEDAALAIDFRPPEVRSFADDLAAQDAMRRSADFIRAHIGGQRAGLTAP